MEWIFIPVLLICSALFSGLNLGIMSLSPIDLKRKARHGSEEAKRLYPIRVKGNQLLTTVLLGNVLVNSILAVMLGNVLTGVIASLIATALIFIFGEIIPQAVFARHAMRLSGKLVPVVRFFLFILYPVAKPLSLALDHFLGDEVLHHRFSKSEIISFISEQEDLNDAAIDEDEERIVHGALLFSNTKVEEIMTPRAVVQYVQIDEPLSQTRLAELRDTGHSRFPVVGKNLDDIRGILYLRDTVGANYKTVSEAYDKEILRANPRDRLDKILNLILRNKLHMCIVQNQFGEFNGVITLEDILEEVLQREIIDEDDKIADLRKLALEQASAN